MKPQHYDILGVFVFAYLTWHAVRALMSSPEISGWLVTLLIIGIVGFVVDSSVVLQYFVFKKR